MATYELGLGGINGVHGKASISVSSTGCQRLHNEVEDVEELGVVLRLRGIRQQCSDVMDFVVATD
jgi:hypothetical protein